MHLMGLDKSFNNIGFIKFTNLQWKRRYYEPGQFSAQIRADDYDPSMVYLIALERPEVGLIQRIRTNDTVKGSFVQLEGFFAEKELNRSVIYPRFQRSGTPPKIAKAAVTEHPPDGLSMIVDGPISDGQSTSVDWLGQQLGESIYELLQTQGYSQRVTLDYQNNQLHYSVWQGLDRTQKQNINPFAMFSDASAAVDQFKLTEDGSGYKNFAVIGYGEEESPQFMEVDLRQAGEPKRQIFLDYIGNNESEEAMRQSAVERLQQYQLVRNAEIKTIQYGLVYLRDYDLGDKCDVVNHRLKKSYETRIIGIDEVVKGNQHTVSLITGEKIPTNYASLSRLARNVRR